MTNRRNNHGVVLITVVFVAALLAAIVTGMLQMNTEDIQVAQNHARAAEALAVAEAGLNDALAQLRADATWNTGYEKKAFAGGMYTVMIDGTQITSLGTSAQGFVAKVWADVDISAGSPPHTIEIDSIKVNE